jgi:hypothetical protein
MTQTLPEVTHAHHARLIEVVDTMPAVGDLILVAQESELRPSLESLGSFLVGSLVPHMDATEPLLFAELERLLQNRHSMTPLRREHAEIRRLVAEFGRLQGSIRDARHTLGRAIALRRVVFQLYALLKVHLSEEEMYVRIIDHDLAEEAAGALAAAIDDHPIVGR